MNNGVQKFLRPALFLSLMVLFPSLLSCAGANVETAVSPKPTTTTTTTPPTAFNNVTPAEANDLIRTNQGNTKFTIIDVRTPPEYDSGHLQNAVNLDSSSASFKTEAGRLDKNSTYLVYCQTGVRSAAASQVLLELGFSHISNMTGGITTWLSAGLPVVK